MEHYALWFARFPESTPFDSELASTFLILIVAECSVRTIVELFTVGWCYTTHLGAHHSNISGPCFQGPDVWLE